jgi:hypothetical protein
VNPTYFIIISVLYVSSIAIIDGCFNRLVFREYRKFAYSSKEKQNILRAKEWRVIGVFMLLVLPFFIPFIVSYAIGGIPYVLLYLIVFNIVEWDLIFGYLVFDNWFGDTPSIALPGIGWIHVPLKRSIYLRLFILSLAITLLALYFHLHQANIKLIN